MEREPKPTNIAGELMTQRLPNEETERSVSAQIQKIRPVTRNNRTYQVLEFTPVSGGRAQTINVFSPDQLKDLEPGMAVELTLVRKNNFWNLGTVKKVEQPANTPPAPLLDEKKPSEAPTKASFAPTYRPANWDLREYRIMSMNALNNAVAFVTNFRELLNPTNPDEAFALVDYYRSRMIEMHDPNYGNRTRESE